VYLYTYVLLCYWVIFVYTCYLVLLLCIMIIKHRCTYMQHLIVLDGNYVRTSECVYVCTTLLV
jgi:hypothetical protein